MKHICDYGCENDGIYKIGKKYCCSESYNSCPAKKIRKLTPREKPDICDYGCGQQAIYSLKNGKWCCSASINKCPSKKEKSRIGGIGKKHDLAQPINTNELCSFGCGEKANFIYKNKSYCCKDDWHRCPGKHEQISKMTKEVWSDLDRRKRLSKSQRKDLFAVAIPVLEDKVCQDCGQRAYFWFKTNDRYSCSDRIERCPVVRIEISERFVELWKDEEFRNKVCDQDYNDPERKRKQVEGFKKWCKENKDLLLEKARKASLHRIGKTWEEIYGEVLAAELKIRARDRLLDKTYIDLYGEEKALDIGRKISIKLKGRKETRQEVLSDMSEKKKLHWLNPEYAKKVCATNTHGMNKPEKVLNEIIEPLGFIFVGNYDFMVHGKNPDFVNHSNKKIIEHFGDWWHGVRYRSGAYNDYDSNEIHAQKRIDHFKSYGYECLIIWENELKNMSKVIEKILEFNKDLQAETPKEIFVNGILLF